jgi:GxxExxY protein
MNADATQRNAELQEPAKGWSGGQPAKGWSGGKPAKGWSGGEPAMTSRELEEPQRQAMNRLSGAVIGGAQEVSRRLGTGFLEKVYENALFHELRKRGVGADQQRRVQVVYDGEVVGAYIADLVVEDRLIVEIKAVVGLDRAHRQQCLNYLRATNHRLCLLLNFGRPRLEVARIVWHF